MDDVHHFFADESFSCTLHNDRFQGIARRRARDPCEIVVTTDTGSLYDWCPSSGDLEFVEYHNGF